MGRGNEFKMPVNAVALGYLLVFIFTSVSLEFSLDEDKKKKKKWL